ncbi:tetratricopeptide repeat protein [Pseudomonadota bacterium]
MKPRKTKLSMPWLMIIVSFCLFSGNSIADKVKVSPKLLAAAESGDVESQYNLGLQLCCSGKDTKKAVAWLCRATKQNHFDAPYQIGNIYSGSVRENGKMVKSFDSGYSDLSFAYMWYTVAMAQGHDAAARGRTNLEKRMSQKQIMQGKRWATGWKKMRCPPV